MDTIEMFTCKTCKKLKLKKEFSAHKQCKHGVDISACKACKKAKVDWKDVPLNKRIYNRIKSRAKKKGMAFNLELSDIVLPKVCPVLKKPLKYGDINWTYSVDRIDNSKGYIKGNITIMSNRANRLKGDFTKEELKSMLKYLK